MSTRSLIGTINNDGTVKVIYCHWDGYPEVQLPMLIRYYNTPEKVNELLELGDISYLGKWVKPDEGVKHTFNEPADGVTVAYHRDRGEEYNPPFVTAFDRLFREYDGCWIEYFYLFDGEMWHCYEPDGEELSDLCDMIRIKMVKGDL